MSFLKAEWRKLAMANYVVSPELLLPYLPAHTELDFWEDRCYVSLVGFMFVNTRVLGIPVPFHVNFEEANLRFYVRCQDRQEPNQWKRGVVFIKEIVPRAAITWVANTLYKEHYQTLPMRHRWTQDDDTLLVEYAWKKNQKWHTISLRTEKDLQPIEAGSEAEFITEHYWGYTRLNQDKTSEYEVGHPRWEQYPLIDYQVDIDFGSVYGKEFAFLNQLTPHSVFLAEGSPIRVEGKSILS
jgi:uncharacterized protein